MVADETKTNKANKADKANVANEADEDTDEAVGASVVVEANDVQ